MEFSAPYPPRRSAADRCANVLIHGTPAWPPADHRLFVRSRTEQYARRRQSGSAEVVWTEEVHYAEHLEVIWLTRAVQNVIGNAVKYTDPGGHIDIVVDHDDVNVEIRVRDTGIGLAPADLETVFLLYTRATQLPTRPSAGGLGVGLHLAKVVVEAHSGSIRATSEGLGRGSTFVLCLPCRRS